MLNARQHFTKMSANIVGLPLIVLIVTFAVNILDVQPAYAQTLTVLHSFAGPDGEEPYAGLAMDRAGNLYGTTPYGGNQNSNCYSTCGVVFRIARGGSGWVFAPLYDFEGGTDGSDPLAVVAKPGLQVRKWRGDGHLHLGSGRPSSPAPRTCLERYRMEAR